MTPLFQVHASGWPFIAHRRIGLSSFWAVITPSQNVGSQWTVSKHRSGALGRMRSRHEAKVLSFSSAGGPSAAASATTNVAKRPLSIGVPPQRRGSAGRCQDEVRATASATEYIVSD